jgi:enoyl-CoA hydratase/carnithine racemase
VQEPPQLDSVIVEFEDRVAIITLNRPDAMNAWNGDLNRDLEAALRWAAGTDEVGAVVITGAGRAFCAGADLSAGATTFSNATDRGPADDSTSRTPHFLPWHVPKPVIAALNGHAVGVGATYALACDMRIAAAGAKIGFVFTRRGMLSELASHAILPRVVGMSHAADLLLSGRAISADEALAMGLVSAVTTGDEVRSAAVDRARDMAVNAAPVSMAISKRLLWDAVGIDRTVALEEPLFAWVAEQADAVEGVASFLEKRRPSWNLSVRADLPEHLFDGSTERLSPGADTGDTGDA